ncbi:hypothetical protein D3C87_1951380 [compost metagenome]
MSAEQASQCQGCGDLCTVDQRETLLGCEHDRLEAGAFKGRASVKPFAVEEGFTFAHHYRCHMSQWREVAGGAY